MLSRDANLKVVKKTVHSKHIILSCHSNCFKTHVEPTPLLCWRIPDRQREVESSLGSTLLWIYLSPFTPWSFLPAVVGQNPAGPQWPPAPVLGSLAWAPSICQLFHTATPGTFSGLKTPREDFQHHQPAFSAGFSKKTKPSSQKGPTVELVASWQDTLPEHRLEGPVP